MEDINAVLVAELQEACEETQSKWQPEEEQLWAARRRHLEKMNLFQAFERVPRQEAQNPLTTVWVDKVFGEGWKSRLTVHGFKQKVDRTVDFYSETPQSQSARLLLTIAARDGLLVAAGDAEAAFLQAPLLEEVYVEPPPEAGEPRDVVYRALKALPGLRGSPVAWGAYATSVLTKTHEMEQSQVDPCLYHRPPCPQEGGPPLVGVAASR